MTGALRSRSILPSLFLVCACVIGVPAAAEAQAVPPRQSPGQSPAARPSGPTIESLTQGFERREGFFNLYVNMKEHRLLGEIPNMRIGRRFLLATSISGGLYAGWQWDDRMVYWERHAKKLVLVEPEIRYRGEGTIQEIVKRTYRDRVITSVPILAEKPGTSVLIDLSALLVGQSRIFLGSLGGGIDTSLTKISKAKAFPHNVEIEFDMVRGGSGLAVHYSIKELPKTNYKPRPADDRVGYFVTAYKDFSKNPRDESRFVRFINRWHLEKADPSLKLSPPKEPIVFYIEKTVPVRYRRYVKEGILEWNKAFEKIGIIDAIIVRQQTETDFADLDPEDVRYNFFRWITSESSFAMGPSRVNPETGQILDADIIFDEGMIRSWLEEYEKLIERGPVRDFHASLRRYLEEHPERHPMRRWRSRYAALKEAVQTAFEHDGSREPRPPIPPEDLAIGGAPASILPPDLHRAHLCDYGYGVRHQLNFALAALHALAGKDGPKGPGGAKKEDWPEEFIGQVLKEVVMHEVGHTLGLRHNFKASSWLSLEEINRRDNPPEAITGSVMDYNPTNIVPEGTPQGYWNTRTLGPYDYWAIEYGYSLTNDPKELAKIAARGAEKGHAYATDEDVPSSDPLVNRFDMGDDPIKYARQRIALVKQVMRHLLARVVKPGEGYQAARRAFDMLLYEYASVCWTAAKHVGGHYIHRDHKGDPGERPPVVPVPAAKQREALELVAEAVFSKDAFRFPPELLNHLAAGRWYHWGTREWLQDPEYPIHDRILQIQLWSLFDFLNPRTLALLSDAELRVGEDADAVTIPELFDTLTRAIWSELDAFGPGPYSNRKPFISSMRRNLQHEFVGQLIDLALEGESGASPQAARKQAFLQLRKLKAKISDLLEAKPGGDERPALDDYSHAHLVETRQRIEKALEASYTRNPAGGAGAGGLIIIGREGENDGDSR